MKTYTTKLAIGDTAWFMQDNKAVGMAVARVDIQDLVPPYQQKSSVSVQYGFHVKNAKGDFERWHHEYEHQVFATKEELLASL